MITFALNAEREPWYKMNKGEEEILAARKASRVAKAAQTRAINKAKQEQEAQEQQKRLLQNTEDRLADLDRNYIKLLKELRKEKFVPAEWHRLDMLQTQILNSMRTIRKLRREREA